MLFQEKLKKLRKEKNISQYDLAKDLNISRSVVAKWETGLTLPSEESTELLVEYFNISKEELFKNEEVETIIVEKNVSISNMRKLIISLSTTLFVLIIMTIILLVNFLTPIKTSEGLEYEYNKESNYYRVIGIGTCLDEDIVIPKEYNGSRVMIIDTEAFKDCQTIKSVVIPESITTIREDAFDNCVNLERVKIEEGVKVIGEGAFSGCKDLKEIKIPSSITSIEKFTFYDCLRLEKVELPQELTSIGYGAFSNCRSLKEITIPENVTTVKGSAFLGCKNLVVYCEAIQCPAGWSSSWDHDVKEVLWKGQQQNNLFEVEYKKDDFKVKEVEGLSEEMYLEISMAYAKSNFSLYGLDIHYFYGEYDGAYVFSSQMPVITFEELKELEISGIAFPQMPDFMQVMVYKNGYVYTLKEAYEIRGTITRNDLIKIKEQIELKGYF